MIETDALVQIIPIERVTAVECQGAVVAEYPAGIVKAIGPVAIHPGKILAGFAFGGDATGDLSGGGIRSRKAGGRVAEPQGLHGDGMSVITLHLRHPHGRDGLRREIVGLPISAPSTAAEDGPPALAVGGDLQLEA